MLRFEPERFGAQKQCNVAQVFRGLLSLISPLFQIASLSDSLGRKGRPRERTHSSGSLAGPCEYLCHLMFFCRGSAGVAMPVDYRLMTRPHPLSLTDLPYIYSKSLLGHPPHSRPRLQSEMTGSSQWKGVCNSPSTKSDVYGARVLYQVQSQSRLGMGCH